MEAKVNFVIAYNTSASAFVFSAIGVSYSIGREDEDKIPGNTSKLKLRQLDAAFWLRIYFSKYKIETEEYPSETSTPTGFTSLFCDNLNSRLRIKVKHEITYIKLSQKKRFTTIIHFQV